MSKQQKNTAKQGPQFYTESGSLVQFASREGQEVLESFLKSEEKEESRKAKMEQLGFQVLRRKDGFYELEDRYGAYLAWKNTYNKVRYQIHGYYGTFSFKNQPPYLHGHELSLWERTYRDTEHKIIVPARDDLESFANSKGKVFSQFVAVSYMFTVTVQSREQSDKPKYDDYMTIYAGPFTKISEVDAAMNDVQYYLDKYANALGFGKSNRGLVPATTKMMLGKSSYRRFRQGEDSDRRLYVNVIALAVRENGSYISFRNTFGEYRKYNRIIKDPSTGKWRMSRHSDTKRKRGRPKKTTTQINVNITNTNTVGESKATDTVTTSQVDVKGE